MDAVAKVGLLVDAYRAFNARRADDLLAMMTEDVEWPDVANGAVLRDHESIRSYWQAQFDAASPVVELTDFVSAGDDVGAVVRQQVFGLDGEPLTPATTVFHRYSFAGDLVCRMRVFDDRSAALR